MDEKDTSSSQKTARYAMSRARYERVSYAGVHLRFSNISPLPRRGGSRLLDGRIHSGLEDEGVFAIPK